MAKGTKRIQNYHDLLETQEGEEEMKNAEDAETAEAQENEDFDFGSEEATQGMGIEDAIRIAQELPDHLKNKDGTPDMRLLSNRRNPDVVAAFNILKKAQLADHREPGRNKDGSVDMRIRSNRDNPEIVKIHYQGDKLEKILAGRSQEENVSRRSDRKVSSERRLRKVG